MTDERLDLLCAMAELAAVEVRGAQVSPLTQKAVLMVLASAGGRPVCTEGSRSCSGSEQRVGPRGIGSS